jgi:hypothetical protein
MDQLLLDFLDAYAEYQGWSERGWESLSRKLCEEYKYSPKHGREFLMIAFGWTWGHSPYDMAYVKANCLCGLLQLKLDEVWGQVAKENHWPLDE